MAAPTVVAVGSSSSGTTSATPAVPSGTTTNDIILLFVETNSGEAITVPAGYAHVTGSPVDVAAQTRLSVLWKRAGASETAPTIPDPGDHICSRMLSVRGAPTSGNPWHVIQPGTETVSDTSVAFPAVTTTVADALVVNVVSTGTDALTSNMTAAASNANLTSITERIDTWTGSGGGGGIGVITGVYVGPGSTGQTTVTLDNAGQKALMTLAFTATAGSGGAVTVPGAMTASASLPAPTATGGATVTSPALVASASLPVPVVSGQRNPVVTVPAPMAAVALAQTPATGGGVTVVTPAMQATAAAPAPGLHAGSTITAPAMTASAAVPVTSGSSGGWITADDDITGAGPSPARTVSVATTTAFKNALTGAADGDEIVLASGSYSALASVTLNGRQNVTIRAASVGGAQITGASTLQVTGASNVIIDGLRFQDCSQATVLKLTNSPDVRISRCTFDGANTTSAANDWVYITGTSDRFHVTRCEFRNKADAEGDMILVDGDRTVTPQTVCKDGWIDLNWFHDIGPRQVNEFETIRYGWSGMARSSARGPAGRGIVERNLFERCDGDPEALSIKSCDLTVRFNTYRDCYATAISQRHGTGVAIHHNWIFGNPSDSARGGGGIRIYDADHAVYNNYLQDLLGNSYESAISVDGGDADSGTDQTKHWRVHDAVVVHNTLVGCTTGIVEGEHYSFAPEGSRIADNIVVKSSTGACYERVKTTSDTVYQGNIARATGSASATSNVSSGVTSADPGMSAGAGGLQRPATAFTASQFYPALTLGYDIDGEPRATIGTPPDAGADELPTATPVLLPAPAGNTGSEVGPATANTSATFAPDASSSGLTVTGAVNPGVTAPVLTATAGMLAPTVSATATASVTAPVMAAAATAPAPAVAATTTGSVSATAATATAGMPVPAVSGTGVGQAAAPAMTAAASLPVPTVSGTRNATIVVPSPAHASATVAAPSTSTVASVTVTAPVMHATASLPVPALTGRQSTAGRVTLTVTAHAVTLTEQAAGLALSVQEV